MSLTGTLLRFHCTVLPLPRLFIARLLSLWASGEDPEGGVPGWRLSVFLLLPPATGPFHTLSPGRECCDKLNCLPHSALTGPHRPRCSQDCLQHSPQSLLTLQWWGDSRTSLGFRVLGICQVVQCNARPSSEGMHLQTTLGT